MPYNTTGKECLICKTKIPMPRKRDLVKVYCGRKCVAIATRGVPEIPCPICAKSFKPKRNEASSTGKVQHCSIQCSRVAKRVTHIRKCQFCGKAFRLENIAYERRGSGKFCSQSCGTRKYPVNEDYFHVIDTEEKAYWLGFLFADGYQNGYEMKINLNAKDASHLEKLREALNSKHPVTIYVCPEMQGGLKATYRVGSKKLCTDLANTGCVRAKSLIVEYPKLEPGLDRHFIRGVFDGDGNLSHGKGNSWKWSIFSGSIPFITEITNRLTEAGIDRAHQSKADGGHVVAVSNKKGIRQIKEYLYGGATVWLDRKGATFAEVRLE